MKTILLAGVTLGSSRNDSIRRHPPLHVTWFYLSVSLWAATARRPCYRWLMPIIRNGFIALVVVVVVVCGFGWDKIRPESDYIIKYLIRVVSTNRISVQTKHLVTVGSVKVRTVASGAGRDCCFSHLQSVGEIKSSIKCLRTLVVISTLTSVLFEYILFILSDSKIRGNVWLDAGEGKMLIITQLSRSQF